MSDTECSIEELASEYLRAVDEREAAAESFLADCAEDYYEPGFLDDSEWETLKTLVRSDEFDTDDVLLVIEVATYRKAATEFGREDEFDGDWPAKGGDRDV